MAEGEKRVPNFTQAEKIYLINLISQKFGKIIEDKKTNRTSVDEKKEVWKEVEQTFNASGPMVCYRNADSLRRLYENKKKALRKKLGEEKKQRLLTGGGSMPSIIFDELDKLLMSILNEKCLTGLQNPFDCNGDEEIPIQRQSGDYEFEFISDEVKQDGENLIEIQSPNVHIIDVQKIAGKIGNHNKDNYNISTCSNVDSTPIMHLPLQSTASQKSKLDDMPETEIIGTPVWKKLKSDNLKLPLSSALQNSSSIQFATPSGTKTKPTNRRRPMLTRALTTSDISEKYNILLDKRMALLEKQLEQTEENTKFQKEEHKLKLELLHVELQYKKILLRNLGNAL